MGKLGWFMSKTSTATSPPREGEPVGDHSSNAEEEEEEVEMDIHGNVDALVKRSSRG